MADWTPDDVARIGDHIINHTTPDQRWRELADSSARWPCTGGTHIGIEKLKEWGKDNRWFQKRAQAFAERNPDHLSHLKQVYSILLETILDRGAELGPTLAPLSKLLLDYQANIGRMLPREDADGRPEYLSGDMAKDIANRVYAEEDMEPSLSGIDLVIGEETPS